MAEIINPNMVDNLEKAKLEDILLNAENLRCECGCTVFTNAVIIKKISRLASPRGVEEVVPVPVYVCNKCGKVLKDTFKSEDNYKKAIGENKIELV